MSRRVSARDALRRHWQWLDGDAALRMRWLLPLLFGLLSLLLGQDNNWDLINYHLYNSYALIHGKIGLDLGPGQWQSYFNPLLDLVYYALVTLLPGPLAGFAMGTLHGLNLLLVFDIARRLSPPRPQGPAVRLPLCLALAGCMGCAFFSELGNSMGDNLTALCVLGTLSLILRRWDVLASRRGWTAALLAGLLMGAGCGLKLTNATYAVGACLALLLLPGGPWLRIARSFSFGIGVLAGIAATAGHWFWRMWSTFGNPLFPQFNDLFHGPLAAPIGIGDTRWLPQGWAEKLLWPFIFSLDSQRVSEIKLKLLLWPLLYVAIVLLAVVALRQLLARRRAAAPLSAQSSFILAFFVLSYGAWQSLFSIYRYLVPLELLAPLLLWLLLHRLLAPAVARPLAVGAIALAVLLALPSPHWGRARWAMQAYRIEAPALAAPQQHVVLLPQVPSGWYAVGFPPATAFISLGGGFPQSPAYDARAAALMAARAGPHYALLAAHRDDPLGKPRGAEDRRQAERRERDEMQVARASLGNYGLGIDADACVSYNAYIGRNYLPYRLCPVSRR